MECRGRKEPTELDYLRDRDLHQTKMIEELQKRLEHYRNPVGINSYNRAEMVRANATLSSSNKSMKKTIKKLRAELEDAKASQTAKNNIQKIIQSTKQEDLAIRKPFHRISDYA